MSMVYSPALPVPAFFIEQKINSNEPASTATPVSALSDPNSDADRYKEISSNEDQGHQRE